jgi:hypothetical protein
MNPQIISKHLERLDNLGAVDVDQVRRRLSRQGITTAETLFVLSKAYLLSNEFSFAADLAATSICLDPAAAQPWHTSGMAIFRQDSSH